MDAFNQGRRRKTSCVLLFIGTGLILFGGEAIAQTRGDVKIENYSLSDINDAIRVDPDNSRLYGLRARLFVQQSNSDAAIKDYERQIELSPESGEAFLGRAQAWTSKKDFDKAISDFSRAIDLMHAMREVAYIGRGTCRARKGDFAKALADYDEAIRIDPDNSLAYSARFIVLCHLQDWDKALVDVDALIRLNPESDSAYFNQAEILLQKGHLHEAIDAYTNAIQKRPSADSYCHRGRCRSLVGEYKKAAEDFQKAIDQAPKSPEAYQAYALQLAAYPDDKARGGQEAVQLATKAAELTQWENGRVLEVLALAHAEAGDFDDASKQLAAAETLSPGVNHDLHEKLRKLFADGKAYRMELPKPAR